VFPTLTSDKIQELVIETETGIDVASLNSLPAAPGNPPRSALAPEAIANLPRPPVRQTKIESWLLTSKTAQPPIPSGSSDAPKSLDIPADVDIPAEVSSEHKLLPSSFSKNGWKLFDHELRVATDYKLAKQDTKPFKDWIPAQGHRHLFDLLKKCTHPDIWEHCVDGDKAFDRDFLLGLPSREIDSPGWYLIVLYDEDDISWWRDYVGQSGDVTRRWRKHQSASTNQLFQALIYEVWRNGEPIPEDGNLPRQAKFISLGCDVSGFDDDVDAAPPSRRPLTIPKHSTTTPFRSCTARYRFSSSEHPRMQVQGQVGSATPSRSFGHSSLDWTVLDIERISLHLHPRVFESAESRFAPTLHRFHMD
jgi:hypothetical protein